MNIPICMQCLESFSELDVDPLTHPSYVLAHQRALVDDVTRLLKLSDNEHINYVNFSILKQSTTGSQ